MKKHTVRSLSHRAAALVLALALALPTVYAHAGEQKLQTSIDLVDGLTYRNTITDNSERRVESFSLELEEDSDAYPILLQAAGHRLRRRYHQPSCHLCPGAGVTTY